MSPRYGYMMLAGIVAISILSVFWQEPTELLKELIEKDKLLALGLFSFLMFFATVIAPVTVLPIVPLVAPIFGPFVTAIVSVISWTLGAVVAFLIARHAGKPLLQKIVSLEKIEKFESKIPGNVHFLGIVVLRMLLPVDILSYALGLFSRVSLTVYTLATIFGVTWFSFAFAYLGSAAASGNTKLFIVIVATSLFVLGLGWWYVVQQGPKK